jgi:hypothetical protein
MSTQHHLNALYSTVTTASSGISTNWLMNAGFFDLRGTGSGRSLRVRGMNMLVMQGILQGMQLADATVSGSNRR